MKLSKLAKALQATIDNGSSEIEITGVAGIEEAAAGQVTFVANPKYAAAARTTRASAVIVSQDFPAIPAAMLRSKNPYFAFARAVELFTSRLATPRAFTRPPWSIRPRRSALMRILDRMLS
jgi:UDP-3-O-[3-hydroxymyristoyl] glucosamine N-acyltransferase